MQGWLNAEPPQIKTLEELEKEKADRERAEAVPFWQRWDIVNRRLEQIEQVRAEHWNVLGVDLTVAESDEIIPVPKTTSRTTVLCACEKRIHIKGYSRHRAACQAHREIQADAPEPKPKAPKQRGPRPGGNCMFCGKFYPSRMALGIHQGRWCESKPGAPPRKERLEPRLTCLYCAETFSNGQARSLHERRWCAQRPQEAGNG